jgi:hypothetical protein
MRNDPDDLAALARFGPTEAETHAARKLRDLLVRNEQAEWSRDDERLRDHYWRKLDAARADGDVVRSHRHANTRLDEIAELLED